MLKIKFDLRDILNVPFIYDSYQEIVGGNLIRRKFVVDYVRAKPGDTVVDIGCGPAQLLRWLPEMNYIGFDTNTKYIDLAQKAYGHRGLFLVGDTKKLETDGRLLNADIVICCTMLHHLDDAQVLHVMRFAHKILKPGGRLVCCEPCLAPDHGVFRDWMMSLDRGLYIRSEEGYRKLVTQAFPNISTAFDPKPVRLSARCLNIECVK